MIPFLHLKIGKKFRILNNNTLFTKLNEYDAMDENNKVIPMDAHIPVMPEVDGQGSMSFPSLPPGVQIITPQDLEKKMPGIMDALTPIIVKSFSTTTYVYGMWWLWKT